MTDQNTTPGDEQSRPADTGQANRAVQPAPVYIAQPQRRSRAGVWILLGLLMFSILFNFILLVVAGASLSAEQTEGAMRPLRVITVEPSAAADTVAVIRIEGLITEQPAGGLGAPAGTSVPFVQQQVEQALANDSVKAVVLYVNSPGGGATASDMMLHELKQFGDRQIPVVVHMGSIAASGGYYVSMCGDEIYAQPTCITGSIGVIAQFIEFKELMNEKLGIKANTIKSGALKDIGNPFTEMSQVEYEHLRDMLVMPMYERFLGIVDAGRPGLDMAEIRSLADGRIYTAEVARGNGLIDEIGWFEDAVAAAKRRAGISEAKVIEYRRQIGLFDFLAMSAKAKSQPLIAFDRDTIASFGTPRVMMLWKP